jgi:hypothetical protein
VIGAVAPDELGKASGILSTMRYLGGVFGVAVAVAVFAAAGRYASAEAFGDGFRGAISVCAVLAVVGALCGAALPGDARRRRAPAPGVAAFEPERSG